MNDLVTRPSPWGQLAVADAHAHFFSHQFFTTLISSPASQKPRGQCHIGACRLVMTLLPQEKDLS